MKIETAAEACAALAAMIVAADELGTDAERQFLFDTVAALPIFAGLDQVQFSRLMSTTTEDLYASFAFEGTRMASDDVGRLVGMICDALPEDQRAQALEAAVGLARVDGMVSVEALLLQRICEGLELDHEAARRLIGPEA